MLELTYSYFPSLQNAKTKVVNRNLNPVWNEELMLSVPSPPQPLKLVSLCNNDCLRRIQFD
jgi:Ca2+-dependent lipid-binding protein